jgi:hypothetical protein
MMESEKSVLKNLFFQTDSCEFIGQRFSVPWLGRAREREREKM